MHRILILASFAIFILPLSANAAQPDLKTLQASDCTGYPVNIGAGGMYSCFIAGTTNKFLISEDAYKATVKSNDLERQNKKK